MTWRFILNCATQSLNVWQRLHWAARAKHVNDLITLVRIGILRVYPTNIPKALQKRRLCITRVSRGTLDVDNLYGGAKPLIDALKRLELIVDDGAEWLDLVMDQRKATARDKAHTVISIEDLA